MATKKTGQDQDSALVNAEEVAPGMSAKPQWAPQPLQHLRNQALLHQARRQLTQLLPQVLPRSCLVTWLRMCRACCMTAPGITRAMKFS